MVCGAGVGGGLGLRDDNRPNSISGDVTALLSLASNVSRSLHTLHHCQSEMLHYQALLEVAHVMNDGAQALVAHGGIRDELHRQALVAHDLLTNIVRYDGAIFGPLAESLGEMALRGAMFVVDVQLYRLRQALIAELAQARSRVSGKERVCALFADSFIGIEEMTWHVRQAFAQLNAGWVRLRATPAPFARPWPIELSPNERATGYRRAIQTALRDLHAIPREPRLATVLQRGWDAEDWPEVSSAASIIFITLGIHLSIEPASLVLGLDAPYAGGTPPPFATIGSFH